MPGSHDPEPTLSVCPYCRAIVGAAFSRSWHLGQDRDTPSCCLTEQYQRQTARTQRTQSAQSAQASSGPIQVAPRRSTQASPLILVDESRP